MTILCTIDTETTAVIQHGLPLDHPHQPHIVQLGVTLHDAERREVSQASIIVNPGVEVPDGAAKVHGITTARARAFGIPEKGAVGLLYRLLEVADTVCCFNVEFDLTVIRIAAARSNVELPLAGKAIRCAMTEASPLCAIPPTPRMVETGYGDKFKTPKLSEAYQIICGKELVGAHDALIDARACAEVYYHLLDRGCWREAA